jgi:hypothetical protein
MAKRETKPRKKPASKTRTSAATRTRNLTRAQARERAKKEVQKRPALPGSFRLTAEAVKTLRRFWKPLGGILVIYTLLNLVFASGLVSNISANVHDIRDNLHPNNGQQANRFSGALNGFGSLVTGANGSGGSTSMQVVLLVLESLVIIWALRQLLAGEKIGVKQSYYHSMTPLVPFLLVAFVVIIQLLPLTVGTAILALVLSSAITNAAAVNIIFAVIFAVLAAWTLYMFSSSLFALYIVTLPEMEPRSALRSAKNLARFRRWVLIRKILFLPLFILLVMGLIIVPLILLADFLVTSVFFVLVMLAVLYSHTYLYSLYRKMIV